MDNNKKAGDSAATDMVIEQKDGFVHIYVAGKLSVSRALAIHQQVIEHYPCVNRLWDFRDADLTGWSTAAMVDVSTITVAREVSPHRLRVAAVAARDVDFGIGRMFESIAAANARIEYRMFRSLASAQSWLGGHIGKERDV